MKKWLFLILAGVLSFSASNDDINKKLDLLLQKIDQLEKKVDAKDKQIEELKKELKKEQIAIKKQQEYTKKEFAIKSCNKIKVVSLKYKYHNEIIPYYDLEIKLKNTYPENIKYIRGSLFAEDSDKVKILQDYIDREVDFKKGDIITINKKHTINNDLEKYLKDENPKNLYIYFKPTMIEFSNGYRLECN
ncbi:hypothetical protein FE773_04625 [Caminibacter mediatlanticus TB-2]|uniref:Uncharacterized protein n=1 Tax=Caminibacter mediatlanticus TB-2 TaxID=391592 RepID=A0AAI9AG72_9BACT|nr:hypothetical protein [Caminibacter mediatlanticus]EDM22919.1 hypothetical protein CMTB2_07765 [Caminibacter mediatlanticus TB-2]QCT94489.1 hypothetical protein FE773_04625 [Caminibacter mediatlanticus TB-2]